MLQRLTSAVESGATTNSYGYGYDLAGNRTRVTTNGVTATFSYNAANQRTDFTYDAAGNLTSDGTTTYAWDALGRLVTQGSTTNAYTGDGVLVQRGSTRYAVDTGRGLSQTLSDGTSTYLYGSSRLASSSGGTRVWHLGDALGSVRQTLDDSGAALGSTAYTPWGEVQSGTVPTFGFTGELQTDGLVQLRARWYNPGQGTLTARDAFAGLPEQPYSLHPYQYGYSNPVQNVDPTGLAVMPAPQDGEPPEPSPRCPPGTIDLNLRDYANNPVCIPDGFDLDKNFRPAPSRPALRFQPLPNGTILLNQTPAPAMATTALGGRGGTLPNPNDVVKAGLAATICAALILAILGALTDADVNPPKQPQKKQKLSIFKPGADTPLTTEHISDAIVAGQPTTLTYLGPGKGHPRGWYNSDIRCKNRPTGYACDEYPFRSVVQGGQANKPSLRPIPIAEQRKQGGEYNHFLSKCKVKAGDSFEVMPSLVLVATTFVCK